jgi:hypothetical protein
VGILARMTAGWADECAPPRRTRHDRVDRRAKPQPIVRTAKSNPITRNPSAGPVHCRQAHVQEKAIPGEGGESPTGAS